MTIKDIVPDIHFRLYGKQFYWYGNKSFKRLIECTDFLRERYSFSRRNNNNRIRMFDKRYMYGTRKFSYEASGYNSPIRKLNYFKRICRISMYKY